MAAMVLLTASMAQAQLHVSTTGNDTTGDGSAGAPYRTIAKAFTEVASALPEPVRVVNSNTEALFQNAITWVTNGTGTQAALIVSQPGSPNPEDVWMQERLQLAGFTVELVDDGAVSGATWGIAQANAKNLVVAAASISSSSIDNLIGMNVPFINCESWSWDNWGFFNATQNGTGTMIDGEGNNIPGSTQITIAGTAITGLVGSLTGTVTVYDEPWTINGHSYGQADPDIVIDASTTGAADPTVCLWHAEAGALTSSLARTVGFFIAEDQGFLVTTGGGSTVNVRVAAGTYAENDLIMPTSTTLTGGYNAGFSATSGNPADTIIDGTSAGQILGISGGGRQVVRHITLANANAGAEGVDTGALYQDGTGGPINDLLIDNCVFTGNTGLDGGDGENGTVHLTNISGLVRFERTLFDANGGTVAPLADTPLWIETSPGNEVRFTTCTFTNNNYDRRLIGNDDGGDMTFIGCTFDGNTGPAMIRERRIGGTLSMINCTVSNNDMNGNRIFDIDDIQSATGSFVLDGNVFTSNTMGWFFDTTNDTGVPGNFTIRITNNVFHGNNTGSIGSNFEGQSVLVANNTFYRTTGSGNTMFFLENQSAVSGFSAIAVNNIFEATDNYDNGIFGSNANNAWSSVTNNIVFTGVGSDPAPLGTTDGTTAINAANNLVGVDALLLDPENGDFHIPSNSPAVNAGVGVAGLNNDFESDFRPQGAGYDIGADETAEGIVAGVNRWTIYQ